MRSWRKTVWHLIGPLLLGGFIAAAPIDIAALGLFVLLPASVVLEMRRCRKHGFLPLGPVRVGVIIAVIVAAYWAPFKYMDRAVEPAAMEFEVGTQRSVLKDGYSSLSLPGTVTRENLALPDERMSLRALVRHIEKKTGLVGRIGYCGTGMSVLWGAHPMGGIRFSLPAAPLSVPEDLPTSPTVIEH